jgi:hypothetical protein
MNDYELYLHSLTDDKLKQLLQRWNNHILQFSTGFKNDPDRRFDVVQAAQKYRDTIQNILNERLK